MPATQLPLNRYPEDRQVTHRSVRVTRTWRPPGLSVPAHEHELACLALYLDGCFDETIGQRWHQIGRETLVIRPGGVPHANRYGTGGPSRAVIIAPLCSGASTTSTPSDSPLIMRLRRGKWRASGLLPTGNSLITAPC